MSYRAPVTMAVRAELHTEQWLQLLRKPVPCIGLQLYIGIDIRGWISTGLPWIWISMDITLAHLLIKLNTYMLCLSIIFSCLSFYSLFARLFMLLSQMNNQ